MRDQYLRWQEPPSVYEPVDDSWKSYYGFGAALAGVLLIALFVAMLLTLL